MCRLCEAIDFQTQKRIIIIVTYRLELKDDKVFCLGSNHLFIINCNDKDR